MTPYSKYRGPRLNESMVKAQALPGRRFSKDAERKGWLYVNTWYMIGPWENYGRDDFAIIHQPEISVDFDAVYTDGQVGVGIEETESDPIKMIGKEVKLDGTLRWKFMQSESMHNTVPVTTGHSTYYAYTELYFDEATTMLVAIGTDDSGRIWINGKDVWQDKGQLVSYRRAYRTFYFPARLESCPSSFGEWRGRGCRIQFSDHSSGSCRNNGLT